MPKVRVRFNGGNFGGHWRADLFWPTGATEAEVNEDQLALLEEDGQLSVRVLDSAGDEVTPLNPRFVGRGPLIAAGLDSEEAVKAKLEADPNALKSVEGLDDDRIAKIKAALNFTDPVS
ncbi:hypothetical protein Q0M94_03470 [Deinococcus radiomollis]|uniref:hypothetical protein n=1 Tax=Deinococcus radiomollis TaxID=468916 RepID=UPI003891C273